MNSSTTSGLGPDSGESPPGGPARERREQIRARVSEEGFERIETLAADFGVSVMTIHRDLDELQRQGWLRKIRGGATAEPSSVFHGDVRHRIQTMRAAKQEIANTAISLVTPGQSIMLDESTTALALAERLPERAPLTVISNFVAIQRMLAGVPGIELISLGGTYFSAYDAVLGMFTREMLSLMRSDLLFMSTTSITDGMCYHLSQETVAVKLALMAAADRKILLVDNTKLRMRGLVRLAPMTAFDLVIMDSDTGDTDVAALRRLGAPVHIAGTALPLDLDGNEMAGATSELSAAADSPSR